MSSALQFEDLNRGALTLHIEYAEAGAEGTDAAGAAPTAGAEGTQEASASAAAAGGGACIHVWWQGKANERRPSETLTPFFDDLITAASEDNASLAFHLENLEHFNSSTIVVIMQFIKKLEKRRIPLKVSYKASLKWQKMTFDALRQFSGKGRILTIETV